MINLQAAHEPCDVTWAAADLMDVIQVSEDQLRIAVGPNEWLASVQRTSAWGDNGGHKAVVVDLQGIDTMLSASRMQFDDAMIGVVAGRLLPETRQDMGFRRQGAAGSPPQADFPGGEVLVDERLYFGSRGRPGESWSIAGHMRNADDEGSGLALMRDGGVARDARSIYSHTAIWPEQEDDDLRRIEFTADRPVQVLDSVFDIARQASAVAFAAAIRISPFGEHCRATTRTLRHLPENAIRDVREATAIGAERDVQIEKGEQLIAFGTYYPRVESDWEMMRGGKAYEPAGHYHCAILSRDGQVRHVAHLRSATALGNAKVEIELRPAGRVIKVDPIAVGTDGGIVRGSDMGELNVFHRQ